MTLLGTMMGMSTSLTALSEQRKAARSAHGTQRSLPKDVAPLSFADNDYLGLTREPRVAEAAIRAIQDSPAILTSTDPAEIVSVAGRLHHPEKP